MFSRLELLIGKEQLNKLKESKIIVFGAGGVGGYVIEALIRSGIGHICVVDNDVVSISNLNRQIIALQDTVGKKKVDVVRDRILAINPECVVETKDMFYLSENADSIVLDDYDYVVDAIDTISAKIELVVRCSQKHIPIISCMGTGNKMNPALLEVSDIYKTSVCPLAKVMRHELKKRRIKRLKVVYSKEYPIKLKMRTPGSTSFVPSSAGLLIASEIVKDLLK